MNAPLPVVNLDSLLSKLQPQVASKWWLLGIAVGMPKEMLYDLSNCSKEEELERVIEYWLKTREGDLTWREVAEKTIKGAHNSTVYRAEW